MVYAMILSVNIIESLQGVFLCIGIKLTKSELII